METSTHFWRELGILCFQAQCSVGEDFTVEAGVSEFVLESPTVAVITAGAFLTENPNRDPIEWPALPERAEGGMAFPGLYRLTATQDDSSYACVAPLPLPLLGNPMFELLHLYLAIGESVELVHAEGSRALIVMGGKVATSDGVKTPGQKADVLPEVDLKATAMVASHVVVYRLKEASDG